MKIGIIGAMPEEIEKYPTLFTTYNSNKEVPELKVKSEVLQYADDDNTVYTLPRLRTVY